MTGTPDPPAPTPSTPAAGRTPQWIADEYERVRRRIAALPAYARIHFSRPVQGAAMTPTQPVEPTPGQTPERAQADAEHAAGVRARLAAATPAPWQTPGNGVVWRDRVIGRQPTFIADCGSRVHAPDADLIAHAPTDLARLLERAERAERERDEALAAVSEGRREGIRALAYVLVQRAVAGVDGATSTEALWLAIQTGASSLSAVGDDLDAALAADPVAPAA